MKNSSFLTMCSLGLSVVAALFFEGLLVIAAYLVALILAVSAIICDAIERSKQ